MLPQPAISTLKSLAFLVVIGLFLQREYVSDPGTRGPGRSNLKSWFSAGTTACGIYKKLRHNKIILVAGETVFDQIVGLAVGLSAR